MMAIPKTSPIRTIAIIGAGPSGLAAAKYMLAEKAFDKVRIFERRQCTGGMWNYTRPNPFNLEGALSFRNPSDYITPVYDELESNIPQTLIQYSDHPFPQGTQLLPAHDTVLDYLQSYGAELHPYIAFQTIVQKVQRLAKSQWVLDLEHTATNTVAREIFDAVLVASGHFDTPYVPPLKGLGEWQLRYPGSASHSMAYRNASAFNGKKVIVVGHNASGAEISTQIARLAQSRALVSVKRLPFQPAPSSSGKESIPEILELLPSDRSLRFADGSIEHHVDHILFCTGYRSTFPALETLKPLYNSRCTQNLYEHIFYIPDPNLACVAMPLKSVPFPLAENQAAVIARVWSGRLKLPSENDMMQWDVDLFVRNGDRKMNPQEAAHFNATIMTRLHDWSLQAERQPELENDGMGKLPRRWTEKDVWQRSQLGPIKAAFSAKGSERHNIRTPEELAFDFEKQPGDI